VKHENMELSNFNCSVWIIVRLSDNGIYSVLSSPGVGLRTVARMGVPRMGVPRAAAPSHEMPSSSALRLRYISIIDLVMMELSEPMPVRVNVLDMGHLME